MTKKNSNLKYILSVLLNLALLFVPIVSAENISNKNFNELLFTDPPKLSPPQGEYNQKQIEKWRRRYKGDDQEYERKRNQYLKRMGREEVSLKQQLLEGWNRLYDSGDLNTVYQLCVKNKVPFELIFLAMAESHWKNVTSRAGAAGRWQFMPKTARAYGLKVNKNIDERKDLNKSTLAAIRYLKDLYSQTLKWDAMTSNPKVSDNDRWAFAFWSYNRGPGKVKRYYKKLKGNSDPYAQVVGRYNLENANYVNKIFGIRLALIDLSSGKKPQTSAAKQTDRKKTAADKLYENYLTQESKLTAKVKYQRIEDIINAYEEDLSQNRHSEEWVESAVDILENEKSDISIQNPNIFTVRRNYKSIEDILTKIEMDEKGGEMTAEVKVGKKTIEVDIITYKTRPNDQVNEIAIRLTGNIKNKDIVKELIFDLNPQINDLNKPLTGQVIKIPGKYIEIPRKRLPALLKQYYSTLPAKEAERHLKFLNNLDPEKGTLKPGDTIIVPIL